MTPEEFRRYWQTTYPACPPVGYKLRQAYGMRWFRIHSLPGSKRYAQNDGDYQEILRRQNTVLSDVLGRDQPFVLVTTGFEETPSHSLQQPTAVELCPASQPFLSVRLEDDAAAWPWHFFMNELVWKPGMADTLLLRVADEVVANVLFVSVAHHRVFAAYDGGAEIILPTTRDRDDMRHRYGDWLSSHPLGL
jgi:hypothetical protein